MGSNEDTIQIYKGIGLKKGSQLSTEPKQFVFDLDETIGSFSDLYLLFQCIESLQTTYNFTLYDNPSDLVYELLNLYPEFFRYGIESSCPDHTPSVNTASNKQFCLRQIDQFAFRLCWFLHFRFE